MVDAKLCDERHENIAKELDRGERRMEQQDERIRKIEDLTIEMSTLTKQMFGQVKEQTSKPGKRWETIITVAISGVVMALMAAAMRLIIK
ncbi:MAG: hypothetical protein ACOYU3_07285 [Bacillota bacterium]